MQDRFLFVQNDIIIEWERFAERVDERTAYGRIVATKGCCKERSGQRMAVVRNTYFAYRHARARPFQPFSSPPPPQLISHFYSQSKHIVVVFSPSSPSHTSPHIYYMCAGFFVINYTALGLRSWSWLLLLVLALGSWLLVLALGFGSWSLALVLGLGS